MFFFTTRLMIIPDNNNVEISEPNNNSSTKLEEAVKVQSSAKTAKTLVTLSNKSLKTKKESLPKESASFQESIDNLTKSLKNVKVKNSVALPKTEKLPAAVEIKRENSKSQISKPANANGGNKKKESTAQNVPKSATSVSELDTFNDFSPAIMDRLENLDKF